jgi:molecular chaperone GrpE (heat shock protein)
MQEFNVARIESVGKEFDYKCMQAIAKESSDIYDADIVTKVNFAY